jgi:hypothetical protein
MRPRAIGAVFGTAAGLDTEKSASLHRVGRVMLPVDFLRAEQQFGERQVVERLDTLGRPIVVDRHETRNL